MYDAFKTNPSDAFGTGVPPRSPIKNNKIKFNCNKSLVSSKDSIGDLVREASQDLGALYADLSCSRSLFGGALAHLGGDVLSQFHYNTSLNQSKLLMTSLGSSRISSQLSSIKSLKSSMISQRVHPVIA